jgi:hypothetical protein
MHRVSMGVIAMALALGGCREKQRGNDIENGPGIAARTRITADSLMPAMHTHIDSLAKLPVDSLPGVLQAHAIMTSQLLDVMGRDMTGVDMKGDSAWIALRDSVQSDLADLPGLRGAPLKYGVQSHVDRLNRLLVGYEIIVRAGAKEVSVGGRR